ncbi:hypothetical protein QTP70_009762 [Hemibagrus guttatus]|uniref:Fibronectin type-III domain-containing protein n=1 Tax=Hemibagrus guttatus TaxID=175788 RepID=A0AAE0UPV4_9TELE|nr:hypothetical protein QTP70_009762 [Hemibagrus guttatus]
MDSTRSLKLCCGIWNQDVSGRSFKSSPSMVPIMHQVSSTMRSITLSWPQPEQPNGIILDYELRYYEKLCPKILPVFQQEPFFKATQVYEQFDIAQAIANKHNKHGSELDPERRRLHQRRKFKIVSTTSVGRTESRNWSPSGARPEVLNLRVGVGSPMHLREEAPPEGNLSRSTIQKGKEKGTGHSEFDSSEANITTSAEPKLGICNHHLWVEMPFPRPQPLPQQEACFLIMYSGVYKALSERNVVSTRKLVSWSIQGC